MESLKHGRPYFCFHEASRQISEESFDEEWQAQQRLHAEHHRIKFLRSPYGLEYLRALIANVKTYTSKDDYTLILTSLSKCELETNVQRFSYIWWCAIESEVTRSHRRHDWETHK